MCGLTAIIKATALHGDVTRLVCALTEKLIHRGPDSQGHWSEGCVALGHSRLSILELSAAGKQPMSSRDGRWVIAFNGEVYNHHDIRTQLPGPWRGHSDTESIVEGIATWGVRDTIARCAGMFAIAVWDRAERCLWLVRDRMGEKPLYYGHIGDAFRVASELKALLVGAPRPGVDRDALALYLRHNYIPAPYTIWRGVRKLLPGHLLRVGLGQHGLPDPEPWWTVRDQVQGARFNGTDTEAIELLDRLLRGVVAGQMVSDVPLGAFLSGGVDSSAIVALMQAQSQRRIKTFTIGFDNPGYDESGHAEAVANHLGTDHTTLRVTAAQAQAVIPDLPTVYDEPFADSSQIPTLILSRLTKKHVTVSLSGDAGDELFAGYNRYTLLGRMSRAQRWIPRWARRAAAGIITAVPPSLWDALSRPLPGARRMGDKAHKLAGVLGAPSVDHLYHDLVSHWNDPAAIVIGGYEPLTALTDGRISGVHEELGRLQFLDQVSYLPDDILVKVDRAAMSASLETRVPFLDHRVVAFAWSLPARLRVRDGQGKWILRRVLDRYVPRTLIERPKMGFGVPLDAWLRGPLRDWAESLLAEDRLRCEGFFHPGPIRRKWAEHLSGQRNWQYHLWDVLMFQAWHERWRS